MIACYLQSVGLAAPGLESWSTGRTLLLSGDPLHNDPETPYAPNLLPPNERRRATTAIRQAFRAAEDALRDHASDPSRLASVFASSDADLAVLNRICNALTQPERQISPTDFHNSVHNAASGYFSIAIRSMSTTTTVAAFDASFAAGLLEAATLANIEGCDVLFVAYDVIGPPPLLAVRPTTASGSCALLLTATRGPATLARLDLQTGAGSESVCSGAAAEKLRAGCPALRGLPLLEILAGSQAGECRLKMDAGRILHLIVQPA